MLYTALTRASVLAICVLTSVASEPATGQTQVEKADPIERERYGHCSEAQVVRIAFEQIALVLREDGAALKPDPEAMSPYEYEYAQRRQALHRLRMYESWWGILFEFSPQCTVVEKADGSLVLSWNLTPRERPHAGVGAQRARDIFLELCEHFEEEVHQKKAKLVELLREGADAKELEEHIATFQAIRLLRKTFLTNVPKRLLSFGIRLERIDEMEWSIRQHSRADATR